MRLAFSITCGVWFSYVLATTLLFVRFRSHPVICKRQPLIVVIAILSISISSVEQVFVQHHSLGIVKQILYLYSTGVNV
jgi:hypothetical protein